MLVFDLHVILFCASFGVIVVEDCFYFSRRYGCQMIKRSGDMKI